MTDKRILNAMNNGDVSQAANDLHVMLFPEEYDVLYDSEVDSANRSNGINPMDFAYVQKINNRRAKMGFRPMLTNGLAPDDGTMDFVKAGLTANDADQFERMLVNY